MTFNLIYSRDNSGNFTELFQMPDVKILSRCSGSSQELASESGRDQHS
jgi:hypothetical protein